MHTDVHGRSGRAPATVAVLVTSVLWGTTGFGASFAAPLSAVTTGAAAMGIGGAALAAFNWRRLPRVFRAPGAVPIVFAAAAAIVVFTLCFYASMGLAGVALGTIVTICSSPIFAGVLELVIDRTPLRRRWYVAAGLSIIGGVLLVTGRGAGGSWMGADLTQQPAGVAVGLLAGLAYATYAWLLGRLVKPTAHRLAGLDRSAAVAAVLGVAAIPLLAYMLWSGGSLLLEGRLWLPLLYLGLIPMAVGHALFGWSLGPLSASTVTLYTLLEPAVATLLAVWVLGERLTYGGWIGLFLVLLGLVVLGVTWRGFRGPATRREIAT